MRLLNCVLLGLFLILGFCSSGLADNTPLRLPLDLETLKERPESWCGIYREDHKIGFEVESSKFIEKNGQKRFQLKTRTEYRLLINGKKDNLITSKTLEFSIEEPYYLVFYSSHVDDNGSVQNRTLHRLDDGTCSFAIEQGGSTRSTIIESLNYTLEDRQSVSQWLTKSLKIGDSFKIRSLDVEEATVETDDISVCDPGTLKVFSPKTKYVIRNLDPHGGYTETFYDKDFFYLGTIVNGDIEYRPETREKAEQVEYTYKIPNGFLSVDQELGYNHKIQKLVMEIDLNQAIEPEDALYQSLHYDSERKVLVVRTGREFQDAPGASADDITRNLRSTTKYPADLEDVKRLAEDATQNCESREDCVKALIRFVKNYMTYEVCSIVKSVPEIIVEKRGGCSEYTDLFTTLARAAGIPARNVRGYVYSGYQKKIFTSHTWNEVVIDGKWYPVDSTEGVFQPDYTHVLMSRQNIPLNSYKLYGSGFRILEVEYIDDYIDQKLGENGCWLRLNSDWIVKSSEDNKSSLTITYPDNTYVKIWEMVALTDAKSYFHRKIEQIKNYHMQKGFEVITNEPEFSESGETWKAAIKYKVQKADTVYFYRLDMIRVCGLDCLFYSHFHEGCKPDETHHQIIDDVVNGFSPPGPDSEWSKKLVPRIDTFHWKDDSPDTPQNDIQYQYVPAFLTVVSKINGILNMETTNREMMIGCIDFPGDKPMDFVLEFIEKCSVTKPEDTKMSKTKPMKIDTPVGPGTQIDFVEKDTGNYFNRFVVIKVNKNHYLVIKLYSQNHSKVSFELFDTFLKGLKWTDRKQNLPN